MNYINRIDCLLQRLENVRKSGDGFSCRCPAHADRSNSLSIHERDDGTILIHCFAGCSVHEIVAAVGMELADLFPPRPADPSRYGKPSRNPFPAISGLKALAFDALFVCQCAVTLRHGAVLAEADTERLLQATERINAALAAVLPTLKKEGRFHAQ